MRQKVIPQQETHECVISHQIARSILSVDRCLRIFHERLLQLVYRKKIKLHVFISCVHQRIF